jgi:hypothetical protein
MFWKNRLQQSHSWHEPVFPLIRNSSLKYPKGMAVLTRLLKNHSLTDEEREAVTSALGLLKAD